jgi:hypothetical protein
MQYNSSSLALEEGVFPFIVLKAVEDVSKAGNEMIRVQIEADSGNAQWKETVFLVNTTAALWKVKEFCDCVGLDFGQDEIEADELIGLTGRASFKMEEYEGRENLKLDTFMKAGSYEASPKTKKAKKKATKAKAPAPDDDDIPF